MTTKIVVCTTLAAYVMDNPHTYSSWIINAGRVIDYAQQVDAEVNYFAAIELDARGIAPFYPLLELINDTIYGDYWTYTLDDRRTVITTDNRLRHLTMGQNLSTEYATAGGYDWMLFLAADTKPPADVIPKLLEMGHPLVGCEISTYCLHGPRIPKYEYPVEEHLISAACILIHRSVFKQLRWRADKEAGLTDDPAYGYDARTLLGIPSYVRKDCVAKHYPDIISSIETRFRDRDMKVYSTEN